MPPPSPSLPGFSCLRQGPGGFSGGGKGRGGTFLWVQMPVWGTQGSAKGAGAGLCPGSLAGPLSGASLAPQMAQVPCCCLTPPHSRVPPAPPGTTLQQQPRVPAGLGVPAAPCLPAPVSLSPRALPADRLPGKKTRNYKEGRCVSQREGGRGGQECPQRWQMALPRVHCSF